MLLKFSLTNWNISNIIMPWLVIVYCTLKISYLGIKNEKRILEMTFLLFVLIWFGIAPFCQVSEWYFPWFEIMYSSYSWNDMFQAYIIIGTGILFYEIGLMTYKKTSFAQRDYVNRLQFNRIVLLTFAVLIVTSVLIIQYGGFTMFLQSRGSAGDIYGSKMEALIVSNMIKVLPLVMLMYVLAYWKQYTGRKPLNLILLTIFLMLINIYISNPVFNPRYWAGSVLLGIWYMIGPWKRNSFFNWSVIFVIILIVIFPYTDIFRRSLDANIVVQGLTTPLIYKGDYDAFQMVMNAIQYVKYNGVDYGMQILGAVLFWFPRSIWVTKPVGTGQMIAEKMGYWFTNLSAPLWVELYVGFGIIGVIVAFFFYGRLTAWMQRKYIQEGEKSLFGVILPFLAAYQIFILRGDLMNGLAYLFLFLVCSVLFSKYLYKKK